MSDEFRPNWASPPGATIKDIMEERSMSLKEFAEAMRFLEEDAQGLIEGKIAIDDELALDLCTIFGSSKEFWLRREAQYRESLEFIKDREKLLVQVVEAQVYRLNLKPEEILLVKIKSDQLDSSALDSIRKGFKQLLPNNKVAIMSVGTDDDIELTSVKDSSYTDCASPKSYCQDCSCGKKEKVQSETNRTD